MTDTTKIDSHDPVFPDCYASARWDAIPDYMRGGIRRWIENGIKPGSFLWAVTCNNLLEAALCADSTNIVRLADYVRFFYNHAPTECWGSVEKCKAWHARGGLNWPEVFGG